MPHQPPWGNATHASSFHPSSATIRPRAMVVLRNAGCSAQSAGSATPNASALTGTSNGAPSSGPMIRPGHATAATSVRPHNSAITWSEQRVDERRDGARLREHDQQAEQHEHQHDRHEPVLLLLPQELPELREDTALAHGIDSLSVHPVV